MTRQRSGDEFVERLRHMSLADFRSYLRVYIRGAEGLLPLAVPPNESLAIYFARLISRDVELRIRLLSTLPEVFAELSTEISDESIERAMALFGYSRVAGALSFAISLTEELDRKGRDIQACLAAICAQLPTESMRDLLASKGLRRAYTPVCLRALLRIDKQRACQLLSQVDPRWVSSSYLKSCFGALAPYELLQLIRSIVEYRPRIGAELLSSVVQASEVRVCRIGSTVELTVGEQVTSFSCFGLEAESLWSERAEHDAARELEQRFPMSINNMPGLS